MKGNLKCLYTTIVLLCLMNVIIFIIFCILKTTPAGIKLQYCPDLNMNQTTLLVSDCQLKTNVTFNIFSAPPTQLFCFGPYNVCKDISSFANGSFGEGIVFESLMWISFLFLLISISYCYWNRS